MPFGSAPHGSIQPLLPALGSHYPQLAVPVAMRLLAPIIGTVAIRLQNDIIQGEEMSSSPRNKPSHNLRTMNQ